MPEQPDGTAGERPPDPPTPQDPAGLGWLLEWCERLCRLPDGAPAEVVAALDIDGSLVPGIGGAVTVEPPPPGTANLRLQCHGGRVETLTVRFGDEPPTRADFDARFGEGGWLPRVHWDDPHRVAYQVQVAGAPSSCTVFPSFAAEPVADTPAGAVMLRRNLP